MLISLRRRNRGILAAVVGGAGHGAEAVGAARLAVATVEEHANEGLVRSKIECHRRLKYTRGAAMSPACFDRAENTVTCLRVGTIGFARRFPTEDPPSRIAAYISSDFLKGGDDGLVPVARYAGLNQ